MKKAAKKTLIEAAFERCAGEGRAAFVAYVTAGDPDFDSSLKIIGKVAAAGVDVLELGVPFSDPLADGEANQNAAARAIASGMTPMKVLKLAKEVKKLFPELPIVLFTYLNPVAHSGDFKGFCAEAAQSGVDAILPLDLPPEEAKGYRDAIVKAGVGMVSLIAPTTPKDRMNALAAHATSFIYYVSQEGVTGERKEFAKGVGAKISEIRRHSKLPIVVGFGISTPEHVKEAAASGADGVVVGSAIVRKVEAFSKGKGSMAGIAAFVKSLSGALA